MSTSRKTRYIAVMFTYLTALIILAVYNETQAVKAIMWAMTLTSFVNLAPDSDAKKKPPIKGTIQYDRKNYDVPAMRIVFDEEPLNIINYNEVTFKVDRNADLSGLDESK